MKKYLIISFTVFAIFLGAYFSLRILNSYRANQDIDAFFIEFRKSRYETSDIFRFVLQNESEVKSIISRNSKSIDNFRHEETKPKLNLALNETDIEVAWNLNIKFSKHSGYWYPIYFDEYRPDSNTAEQGAAANP